MKLSKLLEIRKVLTAHANEKLSSMTAYKILKFLKATDTDAEFYDKRLNEIIDNFGKRDENGNIENNNGATTIDPAKIEECQKALTELRDTEAEAPQTTFTIHELAPISLSVAELYTLDELISEEG